MLIWRKYWLTLASLVRTSLFGTVPRPVLDVAISGALSQPGIQQQQDAKRQPAWAAPGQAVGRTGRTPVTQGNDSAPRSDALADQGWLDKYLQMQKRLDIAEGACRQAVLQSEDKSRLLAAASHDLRQPIHALGLFLDFLGTTELSPHQRTVFAQAQAACTASRTLLNSVLEYSRVEAGGFECRPRAVWLQQLLNDLEVEFAPQAEAGGLVFRVRESNLAVQADPNLLGQVLRNLISNAIKYTAKGGVLLACRQRQNQVMIEIWDTGIGIHASDQSDIFREFRQLANPDAPRCTTPGLGLGLAIVERLVRRMGARLELRSRPGRGSVFRLCLPLCQEVLREPDPGPGRPPAMLPGLHVHVIEDDAMSRIAIQQLLLGWGCTCEVFTELCSALPVARRSPPDVLVTDFRLGQGQTGSLAIAAYRQEVHHLQDCVIITGDTAPECLREAQDSGATVLIKPLSASQLNLALMPIYAKRRAAERARLNYANVAEAA